MAGIRTVSPDYADVVRLRLLARPLLHRSRRRRPHRASRSSANRSPGEAFGGELAVGQRLAQPAFPFPGARRDDDGRDAQTWEVIGVVADVHSPSRQDCVLHAEHRR